MLEHTKRQVKVSFLSRNSFIFPYVALQFALCFFLSWDGQKKEYVRFSFILFVYSLMVGYSEKKEKIVSESASKQKKRK